MEPATDSRNDVTKVDVSLGGSPAGTNDEPLLQLPDDDNDDSETEFEDLDEALIQGPDAVAKKRSLDRFVHLTTSRIRATGRDRCEIYTDSGMPFLVAHVRAETGGGGLRCCTGGRVPGSSGGPFTIDVRDSSSKAKVMRLVCDKFGSVSVESPLHEVVGYVSAERIHCSLVFTVRDAFGALKFVVRGPRYCLPNDCGVCNGVYQVMLADEAVEVAVLSRLCEDKVLCLQLPESMTPDLKVSLIGVSLLFDRRMFA